MSKQLAKGYLETKLFHMKEELKNLEEELEEFFKDSYPVERYREQENIVIEAKVSIEALEDSLEQFSYIKDSSTFINFIQEIYPEQINEFGCLFSISIKPLELKAYWEGFKQEEVKKIKRKIVNSVWNNTNYFSVVSDAIEHGIYNI